jgi:NAD-dependent deacetylase
MGAFLSALDGPLVAKLHDTDLGVPMEFDNTIGELIELLKLHKGHTVIITGAGVSSHQLPTFRTSNGKGLWEVTWPAVLARDSFYANPNPCWKLLANVWNLQVSKILHPSMTHHVIHELVRAGFVTNVITQNIDGLHCFKEDVNKVVEIHGAVDEAGLCEKCNEKQKVDYLKILQTGGVPHCSKCGTVLKPGVALFGDRIDDQRREQAHEAMVNCDLLIVVGSHCTVDPILSIASEAKKTGCIVAEVNTAVTSASKFMDVSLEGKADDVFLLIGKELIKNVSWDLLDLTDWQPKSR